MKRDKSILSIISHSYVLAVLVFIASMYVCTTYMLLPQKINLGNVFLKNLNH